MSRLGARATFVLLASFFAAGCTRGDSQSASTINVSNDSAIAVIVSINGATVGRVEPGFRGAYTDVGAGNSPRSVTLTTASGSQLSSPWDAQSGALEVSMDPECGTITLWIGPAGPSFGAKATLNPSACPS